MFSVSLHPTKTERKNAMTFKSLAATAACCAALLSLPAAAQLDKAEDAIHYRQSSFALIGHHFGHIVAMATGKAPFDAKVAQQDAAIIETLATLPWNAFGPGTEGGKAKPSLWKEQEKFKELADKMVAQAPKLAAAAKTGNLDDLKAAFGPMGGTCKACHDPYKER